MVESVVPEKMALQDLLANLKQERFTKTSIQNTTELIEASRDLLGFMGDKVKILHVCGTTHAFEAEVEMAITSETEIDDFIHQYQCHNLEVLRIAHIPKRYAFLKQL